MSSKVRKAFVGKFTYSFWYDRNTEIVYSPLTQMASEHNKVGSLIRSILVRADGAFTIDAILRNCGMYIIEADSGESFGANEIVKDMHRLIQTVLIAHLMDTISVSRASRT